MARTKRQRKKHAERQRRLRSGAPSPKEQAIRADRQRIQAERRGEHVVPLEGGVGPIRIRQTPVRSGPTSVPITIDLENAKAFDPETDQIVIMDDSIRNPELDPPEGA